MTRQGRDMDFYTDNETHIITIRAGRGNQDKEGRNTRDGAGQDSKTDISN